MTAEGASGVTAIVLAAGESSRMGEQKLLLPLGGTPIVARVALRALASRADEVIVVLGRDAERLRVELSGLGCLFAENPDYRGGMGTSLRAGLARMREEARAALLILADQPFVTSDMLDTLVGVYQRRKPLAVISRFGGVIAPPHVFDRELFPRLGRPGSEGAKALLQDEAERCEVVDFPPEGLVDVDDPAGYRRAVSLAERETDAVQDC